MFPFHAQLPPAALALVLIPYFSASAVPQLPYFTSNQTIPQYALDFAPLVYLHSDEVFWPSDLNQHLNNVQPQINFSTINSYLATGQSTQAFLTAGNLETIDPTEQELIYLSSKEPIFDLDASPWYINSSLFFTPKTYTFPLFN